HELGEWLTVQVRGEVGAHRVAAPLTHVLRSVLRIEMGHLVNQDADLLWGKQAGKEEIAVAVELLDLCLGKLHGISSCTAIVKLCMLYTTCRHGPSTMVADSEVPLRNNLR